ncbi:MAG: AAA family ATPase, partial [Chloroflexi bacterium]|nr:AAA family ATPase [Chloroflexota bacterium]
MKIRSLRLAPYGAFQVVDLSLSEGVSVVYGPNEAGKTTLLNAYADLLCGISRQTSMAFMAPRAHLRICARLALDDGKVLRVVRMPSNAPNDLLDAETETPIPPERWAALVGALDHDRLRTQFGIDHARLVKGGHALVQGGGDLAELVFEVRTGDGLREGIAELRARLAKLYKPRLNAKSDLSDAIDRQESLQTELRLATATAVAVETAQRVCDEAVQAEEKANRALSAARDEETRLKGLVGSWEHWLEYKGRTSDLDHLDAEGSALSAPQLTTYDAAQARIEKIAEEIAAAKTMADDARSERERLEIDAPLLDQLLVVRALASGREAAASARNSVPSFEGEIKTARKVLGALVVPLGGDGAIDPVLALRVLSVPPDRAADLDDHADRYFGVEDTLRKARLHAVEAVEALAAAESELKQPADGAVPAAITNRSAIEPSRQARDGLWHHVRESWLNGVEPPAEVAVGTNALALHFQDAVENLDVLTDSVLTEAAELSSPERRAIAARARVDERRGAAERAGRTRDAEMAQMASWREQWNAFLRAASLPVDLGVAGWNVRSRQLADADELSRKITELEAELGRTTGRFQLWDAQ